MCGPPFVGNLQVREVITGKLPCSLPIKNFECVFAIKHRNWGNGSDLAVMKSFLSSIAFAARLHGALLVWRPFSLFGGRTLVASNCAGPVWNHSSASTVSKEKRETTNDASGSIPSASRTTT